MAATMLLATVTAMQRRMRSDGDTSACFLTLRRCTPLMALLWCKASALVMKTQRTRSKLCERSFWPTQLRADAGRRQEAAHQRLPLRSGSATTSTTSASWMGCLYRSQGRAVRATLLTYAMSAALTWYVSDMREWDSRSHDVSTMMPVGSEHGIHLLHSSRKRSLPKPGTPWSVDPSGSSWLTTWQSRSTLATDLSWAQPRTGRSTQWFVGQKQSGQCSHYLRSATSAGSPQIAGATGPPSTIVERHCAELVIGASGVARIACYEMVFLGTPSIQLVSSHSQKKLLWLAGGYNGDRIRTCSPADAECSPTGVACWLAR